MLLWCFLDVRGAGAASSQPISLYSKYTCTRSHSAAALTKARPVRHDTTAGDTLFAEPRSQVSDVVL